MIAVLGRPGLTADGQLNRAAGRIALAAAEAGGRVELVGSVGDDTDGEAVALELGRAGIGHAALLRDPAGDTPTADGDQEGEPPRLPRLDAADVDLGLRYIADCHVLVVAEQIDADSLRVVRDAAGYHGAALILLTMSGRRSPADLPESATVLEMPDVDEGAFVTFVGRYAALLESGRAAPEAWHDALVETGWESSAE